MKASRAVNIAIFIFIIISLTSCSDDNITSSDTRQPFEIRPYDYSDDHFFLDTIYKSCFEDYYGNININAHTDSLQVEQQSFEVWIQTDVSVSFYRRAGLHIDLPELPLGGRYNDSLKVVPNPEQGSRVFCFVRELLPSEFSFNKYAGYISFKIDVPDNYYAGVAYRRTKSGVQFGTISTDTSVRPNDTLVLKMVKVQNLNPTYAVAWNMKLRNIYKLPTRNIVKEGFEFDIKCMINGVNTSYFPGINVPIITILGLDKYTNGASGGPNNIFDFIPGRTIDTENGWIIFPTLKPFLTNLQSFIYNGKTIDDSYWYPEIYDQLKTLAAQVPNSNSYMLKGKTF